MIRLFMYKLQRGVKAWDIMWNYNAVKKNKKDPAAVMSGMLWSYKIQAYFLPNIVLKETII